MKLQKPKLKIYNYWLKDKQQVYTEGEEWEDTYKKKFSDLYFNCPEDKLDENNILINEVYTDDGINILCVPISFQGAINVITKDMDKQDEELSEYDVDIDNYPSHAKKLIENIIARLPPSPTTLNMRPEDYVEFADTYEKVYPIAERQTNGKVYSYKFIDPVVAENNFNKKNDKGEYVLGAWRESLTRMSDPLAFAAWVWSVYQPDCKDRQFLYLHGLGNSGKSTLARVIIDKFGKAYSSAGKANNFSQANDFGLADFIGKRLIYINELSEGVDLTKYPIIKEITGGDPTRINRKFLGSISMVLNARIMVVSNYDLTITNDDHSFSRVLYVKIDKPEVIENSHVWENSLYNCYDDFLKFCKFAYGKLYINVSIQSKSSEALKKKVLNITSEDILESFDELFIVTNNYDDVVKSTDFWKILEAVQNYKPMGKADKTKIKNAIKSKYNLDDFVNDYRRMFTDSNKQEYAYRGLKLDDNRFYIKPIDNTKLKIIDINNDSDYMGEYKANDNTIKNKESFWNI